MGWRYECARARVRSRASLLRASAGFNKEWVWDACAGICACCGRNLSWHVYASPCVHAYVQVHTRLSFLREHESVFVLACMHICCCLLVSARARVQLIASAWHACCSRLLRMCFCGARRRRDMFDSCSCCPCAWHGVHGEKTNTKSQEKASNVLTTGDWTGNFLRQGAQASGWNCPTYIDSCMNIALISHTVHQFLPKAWIPRPTNFARQRWHQLFHSLSR